MACAAKRTPSPRCHRLFAKFTSDAAHLTYPVRSANQHHFNKAHCLINRFSVDWAQGSDGNLWRRQTMFAGRWVASLKDARWSNSVANEVVEGSYKDGVALPEPCCW